MTGQTINRLSQSENLMDVLVQIENFLDSLDLYVFKNWIDGEIYQGPNIERYWVELTLRYPYKQMPDPQGGMRLVKHGTKVVYRKTTEMETVMTKPKLNQDGKLENTTDALPTPKEIEKKYWLVDLRIPRRYIEELYDDDIELYDDDIDDSNVDAASDARDEGLDSEDAYRGVDSDTETEGDTDA